MSEQAEQAEQGAQSEARAGAGGQVTLGSELSVNRLGFGAMRITGPGIWGEPQDRAGALRVVRRAVELGVDLIDTAAAYGPGVSEEIISEALYPYPDDLIVATKSGFQREGPNRWRADGRPETIRRDCERSLTLLRREAIDLYQLHTVDPNVPIEDSLATFAELQREGKVRMIGVSNVSVEELRRARAVAEVVSVQNRYSFSDRGSEEVLEVCERDGLAFLPWYPLAAGQLTRARSLEAVAAAHDATPAQVAIAWLLARSPAMLPIPGTSSLAHLEENVAAAAITLSKPEFEQLG
jgi:pyridoxine 4-dehydrogenase